MQTVYFSHCWGVFEGGGVRAAAHAGAYAAARESGISFGRVAGTSGGSIVAALIAAGATPEYISKHLQETDFSSFLSAAKKHDSIFSERKWLFRVLRKLPLGKIKKFSEVAVNSGIHSSRPLQDWLENHLQELVSIRRDPGVKGPIRFSELPLPLHIVATDLTTGAPKVWSKELTPQDSVSFAVRCSCSIPFFYQAVGNGESVLVDGGAVSNLPSFVFTRMLGQDEERSALSRVLTFRLISNPDNKHSISNLAELTSRLSTSIVDGATHIQSSLQPNIYHIAIPTGSVKSTDFSGIGDRQKAELHAAGMNAVKKFVGEERVIVRSSNSAHPLRGFDEKMLLLVQELQSCENTFVAVFKSTYWVDFIFPSILSLARRGIQIVCITEETDSLKERRRLSLLSNLGAEIVRLPKGHALPFDGFVFDAESHSARAILGTMDGIASSIGPYIGELVRFYTSDSDPAVLEMLREKLSKYWSPRATQARHLPYEDCSELDLFARLKNVAQYKNCKFKLTDIEISDNILVLQRSIKEFKLLQIKQHMKDLHDAGCELFGVKKITFLDGSETIITPPILERVSGEKLVLIEGSARFFNCASMGVRNVRAVIVENVQAKLPAQEPKPLSSLRLTSSTTTLSANYKGVEESLFRRIEEAVHPHEPEKKRSENSTILSRN